MQKKLIALAVAGLMSGAAFAQTSVTIGGKFDAGYQFKQTQVADVAGGDAGGATTETLGDGSASTSRITIGAKEVINSDLEAGVSLDLRFGTIEEGKNTATTGGINSNDKKAMYLKSKMLGQVSMGVINAGDNFYLATKPYMVEPKDLEIVKYGITTYRVTALTSRNTEYVTPTLNLGSFGIMGIGSYAFGDNAKSGASDAQGINRGDAYSAGLQWKVGSIVNGGYDFLKRSPSSSAKPDSFQMYRVYASVFPVAGLKLAGTYMNQSGYDGAAINNAYQDKITNMVVSYNFSDKFALGGEYSVVRDVGSNRNSGNGWMLGGAYFLTKSVYFYAATQSNDWQHNLVAVGGKYDGTAANFGAGGSAVNKFDSKYTRVGIVKEF